MSPELQLIVQGLFVLVSGAMTMLARSTVAELRKIAATVEEHGRALAAGNEKFKSIGRDIDELRDDLRDLQRGRWSGRKGDRR